MEKKLKELISKFLQEYTGTGDSGGNATDGNDITSPRPFADDEDEIENYTYKSIYGGDGGHYKNEPAFHNPNRTKMGMFEQSLEDLTRKDIEYDKGKARNAIKRIEIQRQDAIDAAGQGKAQATQGISQQEEQLQQLNQQIQDKQKEYLSNKSNLEKRTEEFKEMPIDTDEEVEAKQEVLEQIYELRDKVKLDKQAVNDLRKQRNDMSKGIQQAVSAQTSQPSVTKQFDQQLRDARKALAQVGKMTELKKYIKKILKEQAYGHATLTTQGAPRTRAVAPAGKDLYTGRVEYPYTVGAKTKNGMMEGAFGMSAKDLAATYSLEKLQSIRDEIMGDMEQEAEPEGGNIADMYADQLQGVDDAIAIKQGNSIEGGPSYDEVYLKSKLVGMTDAYEYDKGIITIYPDLGSIQYKERATQEILFTKEGEKIHFVRAFGMEKSYQELKNVFPKLPEMRGSNFSGFMNVGSEETIPVDLDTAKDMIQAMKIGRGETTKSWSKHYTREPGHGGTGIEERSQKHISKLIKQYLNERKNSNLMAFMDIYKKRILSESAVKKIFSLFDIGKSNEDVLTHYAKKGITVPEQFVTKIRKQYENLKKSKLEIEFSEQEAKDFKSIKVEKPKNLKKISNRLFKEAKTIKKYPIPPEIKDALENTLKIYPLRRFISGLKAINSIPPSYRIFLHNSKYFDIIYEETSLVVKVGYKKYYLGNIEEKNAAIKHINKLLIDPIIKTGEEAETEVEETPPPEEPTT